MKELEFQQETLNDIQSKLLEKVWLNYDITSFKVIVD